MTTPFDLHAKLDFIQAFFDDLSAKAAFTEELEGSGHDDEARILCCIYIESLGNGAYHPSVRNAENFTRALMEFSGDDLFGVVVPAWLLESLPTKGAQKGVVDEVTSYLASLDQRVGVLHSDAIAAAKIALSAKAGRYFEREAWRGTVGNAVYADLRSPGAHWFASPSAVSFSLSSWGGKALPDVTYHELRQALGTMMASLRSLSLSSGLWFGNPQID